MANEKAQAVSKDFSYMILENLLDLNEKQTPEEQVRSWREWDNATAPLLTKRKLNRGDAKIYFLIMFIVQTRSIVATEEYIAETIVQRFEDNTDVFLDTLNELPYLIPTVGSMINTHFRTFSDEKARGVFVENYKKKIMSKLGNHKGKHCIRFINGELSPFLY